MHMKFLFTLIILLFNTNCVVKTPNQSNLYSMTGFDPGTRPKKESNNYYNDYNSVKFEEFYKKPVISRQNNINQNNRQYYANYSNNNGYINQNYTNQIQDYRTHRDYHNPNNNGNAYNNRYANPYSNQYSNQYQDPYANLYNYQNNDIDNYYVAPYRYQNIEKSNNINNSTQGK